jgi:hypothetical protein
MGIPTSEVGYTSATTRRETMKSMTDMWWHWKTTSNIIRVINQIFNWSFVELIVIKRVTERVNNMGTKL